MKIKKSNIEHLVKIPKMADVCAVTNKTLHNKRTAKKPGDIIRNIN